MREKSVASFHAPNISICLKLLVLRMLASVFISRIYFGIQNQSNRPERVPTFNKSCITIFFTLTKSSNKYKLLVFLFYYYEVTKTILFISALACRFLCVRHFIVRFVETISSTKISSPLHSSHSITGDLLEIIDWQISLLHS